MNRQAESADGYARLARGCEDSRTFLAVPAQPRLALGSFVYREINKGKACPPGLGKQVGPASIPFESLLVDADVDAAHCMRCHDHTWLMASCSSCAPASGSAAPATERPAMTMLTG